VTLWAKELWSTNNSADSMQISQCKLNNSLVFAGTKSPVSIMKLDLSGNQITKMVFTRSGTVDRTNDAMYGIQVIGSYIYVALQSSN
jgi:hypothetical protein